MTEHRTQPQTCRIELNISLDFKLKILFYSILEIKAFWEGHAPQNVISTGLGLSPALYQSNYCWLLVTFLVCYTTFFLHVWGSVITLTNTKIFLLNFFLLRRNIGENKLFLLIGGKISTGKEFVPHRKYRNPGHGSPVDSLI